MVSKLSAHITTHQWANQSLIFKSHEFDGFQLEQQSILDYINKADEVAALHSHVTTCDGILQVSTNHLLMLNASIECGNNPQGIFGVDNLHHCFLKNGLEIK